jgi:hypothetical protein
LRAPDAIPFRMQPIDCISIDLTSVLVPEGANTTITMIHLLGLALAGRVAAPAMRGRKHNALRRIHDP